MAKTAKLKKNSKSTSIHSRSAKRAASPSLNLDKSLTSLPCLSTPPISNPHSRPRKPQRELLAPAPNTGITKRKKGKPQSRAQRLRQEKGMERAEAVVGKLEVKVEKATGKGKKRRERGRVWEEVNGEGKGKVKSRAKEEDGEGWEDEEMEEVVEVTEGVARIRPISGNGAFGGEEREAEVEAEIL